jgi:NNP family nitrate/nitrite transporter-like MFS transporter
MARATRPSCPARATATLLVAGYAVPDAVKYVFLGPLVGAGARIASRR